MADGEGHDRSVDATSATVDLHNATVNEFDELPTPTVRVYCVYAVSDQLWNVQIFGGRRKNTPMFATATMTRAQLVALRDSIDGVLEAEPDTSKPKRARKAVK